MGKICKRPPRNTLLKVWNDIVKKNNNLTIQYHFLAHHFAPKWLNIVDVMKTYTADYIILRKAYLLQLISKRWLNSYRVVFKLSDNNYTSIPPTA